MVGAGGRDRAPSHADRLASRDGYFAPGSVIRRVGNTPVTPFLGGGAAVLLQVAHPLVAAGVADHSGYGDDLWRRLVRTLSALYLITYGSKAEADRAAAAVQAVHAHVRGTLRTRLGVFPAGTPYSADDPELMLWVHATLVHASLSAFQRFQHALSRADQETYYREMALVARLFGTPADVIPPTLGDFREYFTGQLRGDVITVTEPGREIAGVILRAPLPTPMGVLAFAHRLATAAQLPQRLRREYGLRWRPLHTPLLVAGGAAVRIGSWPMLRVAERMRPPVRTEPASSKRARGVGYRSSHARRSSRA
jgi:uncharacterized protein (DUF2236 family)